jgi:glycosyltransferase involved in cell wall biosynthesis
MKVFVEGGSVFKDRSGVGQYTKHLLEAMAQKHPENQYTVFAFRLLGRPLPEPVFKKNLPIAYRFIRFLPGRGYNLLRKLHLAPPIEILLLRKPDVVIFPNFVKWPLFSRTKSIVVVYDLSFINFSQYTQPRNLKYMLKFVPTSVKKSDHVVTISNNSRREILEQYKVNPEKVSIVTPAVDHDRFFPRSKKEIEASRHKYKLPRKYILYAGTLEPRKNIQGILQAYGSLSEELLREYALVLAGGKGWKDEKIHEQIRALRSEGKDIKRTGYVPDEDLPQIYSGAAVFVYPSFYEGFGIPPLEAMACGVPVISSDNSSLPEVVGQAGIMVDANDTNRLAKVISEVLSDKKTADTMRRAGLSRAKEFSWESSAQAMIEVIESLK